MLIDLPVGVWSVDHPGGTMTDDRDDLASAKDWLSDLEKAADTGNQPPADQVEAVDSGDEDPAPQPARSPRRMLDRPAELISLDFAKVADKPRWRRLGSRLGSSLGSNFSFSLVQDGNEVAAISTALKPCVEFGKRVRCRHTEVTFKNGGGWTISTHAPMRDKKVLGFKVDWTERDRVVEVKDGGEQIAYLANPQKARKQSEAITATGESVTLQRRGGLRKRLRPRRAREKLF
jgi:hypothetical protein